MTLRRRNNITKLTKIARVAPRNKTITNLFAALNITKPEAKSSKIKTILRTVEIDLTQLIELDAPPI